MNEISACHSKSSPAISPPICKWKDGTTTVTLPLALQRPAHCSSCSMLNGKPTMIMCPTPETSSPVPAHDVPTMIWADPMSSMDVVSPVLLVTMATLLMNELHCEWPSNVVTLSLQQPQIFHLDMITLPCKYHLYFGSNRSTQWHGRCDDDDFWPESSSDCC